MLVSSPRDIIFTFKKGVVVALISLRDDGYLMYQDHKEKIKSRRRTMSAMDPSIYSMAQDIEQQLLRPLLLFCRWSEMETNTRNKTWIQIKVLCFN